jgi:phosphopantothenoylcysteine synthetase/decarboxylase
MTRWRVDVSGAPYKEVRRALEAAGIEITQEHVPGTQAEQPELTAVVETERSEEARRAVEQALESVDGASVGPAGRAD